jgi:hypothetical protein
MDKPKYLALVWKCKGNGCKQFHLAKYLGKKPQGDETVKIPLRVRGDLCLVQCPACGESHPYDPKLVTSLELDKPAPPGFRDIL